MEGDPQGRAGYELVPALGTRWPLRDITLWTAEHVFGGTPPFGHPLSLAAYIDPALLAFQEVWAAAGTPDSVFPLPPQELVRATGAEPADFTES